MTGLKVLSVASEIYPLIKTGGLADVVGALPHALEAEGVDMRTLVPGYPAVLSALDEAQELTAFPGLFGSARLLAGKAHGLNLFVLDAPYLYGRPGNPYTALDGTDWPDNAYRFGALCKVAADIGLGLLPDFAPDVVHMHDWQAGLTAAYMHYSGKAAPGTVMTVHNLAFQGQFPAELVMPLGLPPASFAWDGVEHYGAIGFLKAGLQLASRITTVSPSYATEIMQPETGMGFDGLLRARADRVSGILNGLDTKVWDSASDPLITKAFDAAHLEARGANKVMLRNDMGLNQEPGTLLVGVVSRLSWQKGLDLLLEVLPTLIGEGMQLALLGSGEAELEEKFLAAAEAYPGKIGVSIGYSETLAHRIQAGSDALLVPSRFEPCGLTQLAALRYGAVPVVARVGGLSDTVIDANEMALVAGVATGLQFSPVTAEGLAVALWRTAKLFRDRPTWRSMQTNGMGTDVSWCRPARRYADLYRELCGSKLVVVASDSAKHRAVTVATPGPEIHTGKLAPKSGQVAPAAAAGMASLEDVKGVVPSTVKPAPENGKSVVSLVEKAAHESAKSAMRPAEKAAPDEKSAVPFIEKAAFVSERDVASLVEGASSESVKGQVQSAGMLTPEGERGVIPFAEKAIPDSGKSAISLVETVEPESEKRALPPAEKAAAEEKSAVPLIEKAATESGERVASPVAPGTSERGKGVAPLAGQASPESEKGTLPSTVTGSSEGLKEMSGDSEADESEVEADNVVSIAWRDA